MGMWIVFGLVWLFLIYYVYMKFIRKQATLEEQIKDRERIRGNVEASLVAWKHDIHTETFLKNKIEEINWKIEHFKKMIAEKSTVL